MSDILIKGMEMPTSCYVCPFCDYVSARCGAVKGTPYTPESRYEKRADFCPLFPIQPHGDLIDRAALRESFRESIEDCHKWADEMREAENEEMVIRAEQSLGTFVECSLRAKSAPTIIPAEEGE